MESLHSLSSTSVLEQLRTDMIAGLSTHEHQLRFSKYGPNVPAKARQRSFFEILWDQINSVLFCILLAGAAFSFGFEHHVDGVVIVVIIIVNTTIGVILEANARNATETLKGKTFSYASIMRDSYPVSVAVDELTVGDIFFLCPGNMVPADGRIVSCTSLVVTEAALTGDSGPILKFIEPLPAETPLIDRKNMVYAGAQVLEGAATCVVSAVGKECEIGKIDQLLGTIGDSKTPLLKQMERFGLFLSVAVVLLAVLSAGIAVLRGYALVEGIAFAIGIAVAAIPQGLPSYLVIAFAVGVRAMAKQHALVKSLPSIEVLSSVNVICSDKTGTLTTNQMHVHEIVTSPSQSPAPADAVASVCQELSALSSSPAPTDASASQNSCQQELSALASSPAPADASASQKVCQQELSALASSPTPAVDASEALLVSLMPGIICNAAKVVFSHGGRKDTDCSDVAKLDDPEKGEYLAVDVRESSLEVDRVDILGNPTEAALLRKAIDLSSPAAMIALRHYFHEDLVIPFDSDRKYMAVFGTLREKASHITPSFNPLWDRFLATAEVRHGATSQMRKPQMVLFIKGSPERILDFCDVTPEEAQAWHTEVERLGGLGMRVLALAYKLVADRGKVVVADVENDDAKALHGCSMSCMVGLMDPPRPELAAAIAAAKEARIAVKMITGDHPVTAVTIARMIGLRQVDVAVTGSELDAADDATFDALVLSNDVFARTMPHHKQKIVQSLQRRGHVCCMAGDGVNDAPALKAADLGVAMGEMVIRDAAKMIITDDNFATIVNAVVCGRCTYANIMKVLSFVLPTNGGQAFSIIGALVIGLPVPITALQILWINTVTSITLGLVLVFEPPQQRIMSLPPRNVNKFVVGKYVQWRLLMMTVLLTAAVLLNYHWESQRVHDNTAYLQAVAVNTLSVCQVFYLFNCRFRNIPPTLVSYLAGNRILYIGILFVAIFQVMFTYARPLQKVFHTASLDIISWAKAIFFGFMIFCIVEFEKYLWHSTKKKWLSRRRDANTTHHLHSSSEPVLTEIEKVERCQKV